MTRREVLKIVAASPLGIVLGSTALGARSSSEAMDAAVGATDEDYFPGILTVSVGYGGIDRVTLLSHKSTRYGLCEYCVRVLELPDLWSYRDEAWQGAFEKAMTAVQLIARYHYMTGTPAYTSTSKTGRVVRYHPGPTCPGPRHEAPFRRVRVENED